VTVYLARHAKAGSRRKWKGPDEDRPLVNAGRHQADGIADWLAAAGVTRILTSPWVRCRQTVEPLAQRLGLAVELEDALVEGTPLDQALRVIEKVSDENAVLCTHGDVMEAVIDHARRVGAQVDGDGLAKGATWALETESGAIVSAKYVPPPE
jgi:8-oxo-dGTP diphosphatase